MGVFLASAITFAPVVARRLGASNLLISLLMAAQFTGDLFAFLAAHYLQTKRKMPYMVWAWTIARSMFLLTLFVTSPLPFVLLTVVFWIIVSLPVPGYIQVISAIYPDAIRGRATAYVRVAMTAAVVVVTPLAGQLLDAWGYQIVFPLAGLFGVASGLVFGRIRYEEVLPAARRPMADIWRVLWEDARFRQFSKAFFAYGFGNLMMAPLLPIFLVDELHLSYGDVGVLGLVNSVFWMVGYFFWGRAIDRRGVSWTLQLNFWLTAIVPLCFVFATDMRWVAVAYVFNGITTAALDIGWLNAMIVLAPHGRIGAYTSLHSFLLGIRGLTAPFLGTALLAIPVVGMRGALIASGLLMVWGWVLLRGVEDGERAAR